MTRVRFQTCEWDYIIVGSVSDKKRDTQDSESTDALPAAKCGHHLPEQYLKVWYRAQECTCDRHAAPDPSISQTHKREKQTNQCKVSGNRKLPKCGVYPPHRVDKRINFSVQTCSNPGYATY